MNVFYDLNRHNHMLSEICKIKTFFLFPLLQDVRLSKFYYCAVSESVQTTKNWIDRTLFKSEQK